jgi:integrase
MQELKCLDTQPTVQFWLKKAAHSPRTVKTYLYYFKAFIQKVNLDPEEIVGEWSKVKYDYAARERFLDKHSEIIERFYCGQLDGHTPKAKLTHLAAILSFYRHNKIPVEVDIQEKVYIVNHNRAIQKEEVKRILDHATLRDRCFFLMMLESGLRPQTMVMLRYRNLKADFEAGKVPMMINLDSEMLKDFVSARFTFIGEDGYRVLKEYLSSRQLKDDDVIFSAVHTKQQKGEYLNPSLFSTQFGDIVKKLGLSEKKQGRFRRELNLYTLRKYFRNNVKVSDPAYREFWMGHTLGVDAHYFDSWRDDPKTVETHRKEYERAYATLRIYGPDETQQYVAEKLKEKDEEIQRLKNQLNMIEQRFSNMEKTIQDFRREFESAEKKKN